VGHPTVTNGEFDTACSQITLGNFVIIIIVTTGMSTDFGAFLQVCTKLAKTVIRSSKFFQLLFTRNTRLLVVICLREFSMCRLTTCMHYYMAFEILSTIVSYCYYCSQQRHSQTAQYNM